MSSCLIVLSDSHLFNSIVYSVFPFKCKEHFTVWTSSIFFIEYKLSPDIKQSPYIDLSFFPAALNNFSLILVSASSIGGDT
jgi:hypothetical protein